LLTVGTSGITTFGAAVGGTTRWDRRAVEAALDRASGLASASTSGGKSAWIAALDAAGDRAA
jgi:hypothetical protein